MGRSEYLWVATSQDFDDQPVRACTVKHEMVSWLRELGNGYWGDLTIWRLRNNRDMKYAVPFSVEDLLE